MFVARTQGTGLIYICGLVLIYQSDFKVYPVLGGRLVRSGVIYWSQCVEGLIVMGVVYIAANSKRSAGGGQPRAYMPSGCLRPQLSSPS